ncbi:unnamed protein product, partial [Prorocentrum cordatum]
MQDARRWKERDMQDARRWKEWRDQEASRQRQWERELSLSLGGAVAAEGLDEAMSEWAPRLQVCEQQLAESQEDVRELREHWSELRAEQSEAGALHEARMARLEGQIHAAVEQLSRKMADSRAALRDEVSERAQQAIQEVREAQRGVLDCLEEVRAGADEAAGALAADMDQLHAERGAMRRAWERVQSLRTDATWGYFLGCDE